MVWGALKGKDERRGMAGSLTVDFALSAWVRSVLAEALQWAPNNLCHSEELFVASSFQDRWSFSPICLGPHQNVS